MTGADVEGTSQQAGPSRGGRGAQQAGQGGRGGAGQIGGRGVGRRGRGAPAVGRGRGGNQAGGRGGGEAGRGRGRGFKAKNWCFTINNYLDFPKELPRGPPPVRYLCFGKEVSRSGTPHLQGFISFVNAVYRPSRFLQQYGNGHFERARGTADENADYCSKEGDFVEFGTRPQSRTAQGHHGKRGGEIEQERWEEAWRLAKEGKVEEIQADIRLRHYSTILKVAAKYAKPPKELTELDNTWIWGPPGTGKSMWVHRMYPGGYKKGFSKWFDGFREDEEGHKTVILDDLHPKFGQKEELKNWADLYPFVAEYKGGVMVIRPERIVVTSNYSPAQVRSLSCLLV